MRTKKPNEKIRFDDEILRHFFKLDDAAAERSLFLARPTLDERSLLNKCRSEASRGKGAAKWRERFDKWDRHLYNFERVDNLGTKHNHGAWRINRLNDFLTILDGKIGMALAFNSLLLSGVALLLTWLPHLIDGLHCSGANFFNYLWQVLGFVIFLLLVASLFVLLHGFKRLVWGDLNDRGDPGNSLLQTHSDLKKKEGEYVKFLIIAVALRTNSFRISTVLTKLALIFLAALIITGGASSIILKIRLRLFCKIFNCCTVANASPSVDGGVLTSGGRVQCGGNTSVPPQNAVVPKTVTLSDGAPENKGTKTLDSERRNTHKGHHHPSCVCSVTLTK